MNPFVDALVHLRQWGTDRVFGLPLPSASDCYVGSAAGCVLRLADAHVAPRHAQLMREDEAWSMVALAGATALRQDGQWCRGLVLSPGVEVGIGATTLIAESQQSIALRAFCARLLGWSGDRTRAVDYALRAIRLAASRRAPLVLRGEGDMVPIAHALHRHVFSADAPFIVCDRRRRSGSASVRSPANRAEAVAAYDAAAGGTLCVRARRLPAELSAMLERLYDPNGRVQLVVCMDRETRSGSALAAMPPPIEIPPLAVREMELPRIVEEYARDAIAVLRASNTSFADQDRWWVMERAARTLEEIEKATLRLVALNEVESVARAALLLGMAPISLSRWLRRRHPLPRWIKTHERGTGSRLRRQRRAHRTRGHRAGRTGL